MNKAKIPIFLVVVLAACGVLAVILYGLMLWPKPSPAPSLTLRPIIFVHGGAGSGAQFETQAMRFASNGYPLNYILAFEYDSSFTIETMDNVIERLDKFIDSILAERSTDKIDKVDLVGHSLGTRICQKYLRSSPERASKVAHYVNIDGEDTPDPPGGVPTLAIIAGMGWTAIPGRGIGGAINVTLAHQTHVEVATSAEAFVEMYKFFTGREPSTKDIIPEAKDKITLAGRVVYFPWNTGVEGATLEIWEVDGRTGMRLRKTPEVVYNIGKDGAWGPFEAKKGAYYEFAVVYNGPLGLEVIHYYREPFIRSDHLIRIPVSIPGGIAYLGNRSADHVGMLVLRYKEFWGDQGENNDILEINGVNVVNSATCPVIKGAYRTGVVGIWIYDKDCDKKSDLTKPISIYYVQPFQSGVDLFIPAADPPNSTITLVLKPRFEAGKVQVISIPNWASLTKTVMHRIIVHFNEWTQ
ncbi:MAG: hypothetical protein QXZ58_01025 [Candidatus Nezhaarchaeales archaeon]